MAGYIVFAANPGPKYGFAVIAAGNGGSSYVLTQAQNGNLGPGVGPTFSTSGNQIQVTVSGNGNMGWSVTEFTYAPQ